MLSNSKIFAKISKNYLLFNLKRLNQDTLAQLLVHSRLHFNNQIKITTSIYNLNKVGIFGVLNHRKIYNFSTIQIKYQQIQKEFDFYCIHKKFQHILTFQQLLAQILVWQKYSDDILSKDAKDKIICANHITQVVNSLILLIQMLLKYRYSKQNMGGNQIYEQQKYIKRAKYDKLINRKAKHLSLYIFKIMEFMLGDQFNKHSGSSKHEKNIQNVLIGTFLKHSLSYLSFNEDQKNRFGQNHVNKIIKIYINSFQHIINDPVEHIFVYQMCQSLINIQKRLIIYHEQSTTHYLSKQTEYIHQIQFFKTVANKQIQRLAYPLMQKINNLLKKEGRMKDNFQIYLKVYTQYSRVFLFYQDFSDQRKLISEIQRTMFILLESHQIKQKCKFLRITQGQYQQSFTFLMYFTVSYLIQLEGIISKKQKNTKPQNDRKLQLMKHNIQKLFLSIFLQNQFFMNLKQDEPKLNCLKLQIYRYINRNGDKQQLSKRFQQQLLKLTFVNYPFKELLWIHQLAIKIIQNDQNARTTNDKIFNELILNSYNKISATNSIWTLKNYIKLVNQKYIENQQYLKNVSQAICDWLCGHSNQELLTQKQQDLTQIFQILDSQLYRNFFNKVTALSLGKFKWESLNFLYFSSLRFFYIDTISHELKQGIKEEHILNIQYVRRYILNQYNAMGVNRRQIPTSSYFYKILQVQTPERFYQNYFTRT